MTLRRKCNGAKYVTEALNCTLCVLVGERSLVGRRCAVRHAGRKRSDYADMSNDKTGEKPVRRKPKVFRVKLIFPELVGP